jgi:hypothetical protein
MFRELFLAYCLEDSPFLVELHSRRLFSECARFNDFRML